jgi:hypothetical protein
MSIINPVSKEPEAVHQPQRAGRAVHSVLMGQAHRQRPELGRKRSPALAPRAECVESAPPLNQYRGNVLLPPHRLPSKKKCSR